MSIPHEELDAKIAELEEFFDVSTTGTDKVIVAWANPAQHEEWRCYIDGAVKVRKLNSGEIQVATGYEEWKSA